MSGRFGKAGVKPIPMKKVSIINFKGGVGKTTLSLHLATYLATLQQRVLLIDVDHQSSLSIVILGAKLWQTCVNEQRTVNRVFQSFCNRKVVMPKDELIIKNAIGECGKYSNSKELYPTLDFVSAQLELDDTEIDLASTNYGNANLSDWDKRTLLATWLDQIYAQNNYDYVIFDCPPATKIVSQNALAASDKYIIPVIPDELSSRGVTHFRNLVTNKIDSKLAYLQSSAQVPASDVPKNFVPTTSLAGIVPFLVKTSGNARSGLTNIHTEQIAALRRKWGIDVIQTIGMHYIAVPEAIAAGVPIWNHGSNFKAKRMMTAICTELKTRIDK
jgi:chromosome partitioning protein